MTNKKRIGLAVGMFMVALLIMPSASAWWWSPNPPPNNHSCPQGKDPMDFSWQDGWAGGEVVDAVGSPVGGLDVWGTGTIQIPVQNGNCIWSVKYEISVALTAHPPIWVSKNRITVYLVLGYYPQWPGNWQQVDSDSDSYLNQNPGTWIGISGAFLHVYHPDHQYRAGQHYTLQLSIWGEYFDPRPGINTWVPCLILSDSGNFEIV